MPDGAYQSIVVLRPIAFRRHQHAKRLWVNQARANWRRGNLMMHIRIKRSGVREVTHRFILGNQQDIGIRVRDRFKNVRIKRAKYGRG